MSNERKETSTDISLNFHNFPTVHMAFMNKIQATMSIS